VPETDAWAGIHSGDPGPYDTAAAAGGDTSGAPHGTRQVAAIAPDADARLVRLASEAELFSRHADAQRHHQQRLVLAPRSAPAWCEYGAFLLRRGEAARGVECLREAVAVDPSSVQALVALGCVLMVHKEAPVGDAEDPALVFVRGALEIDPLSVEAGVAMALWLRLGGDDDGARAALKNVSKSVDAGKATYLPVRREVLGIMSVPDDPTPLLRVTSTLLLSLNLLPLAICALDSHTSLTGSPVRVGDFFFFDFF
jgi:tetratricopeptide (TPR) repeat protein